MAKMSQGTLRRRTRALGRRCGRLSVSALTVSPAQGEKVVIRINARYPGAPHPRYRGRCGFVAELRGGACVVRIKDGKKDKELVVLPMHLQKVLKS